MSDPSGPTPIQPTTSESARLQKQQSKAAKRLAVAQEQSKINMVKFGQEAAFNPVTMSKRFETLEEKMRKKETEKKEAEKAEGKVVEVEKAEELANEFEKRNPELESRSLQDLAAHIKPEDSPKEMLQKALNQFGDFSLADESLEYLEQLFKGDAQDKVRLAREELNSTWGREIRAGRNMGAEARAFSKAGLGTPTGLRDLYRDITGNPRDASTLFNEMNEMFSFEKMKQAIDFLLHSLGSDLKSKGPSIGRGELHRLMTESRNLLAVLGVFKFFRGRMDLVRAAFEKAGMLLPARMTFELFAKMFVSFLRERYPSMDKVFQLALKMGISAELAAQIIVFTQMRDAVRAVAPKLYRSEQHKHDVLMSFIESLEELEDQAEQEEEEMEEGE